MRLLKKKSSPKDSELEGDVKAPLVPPRYPTIDFWNATSTDDGRWRPGTNYDSDLPNDLGHQLMFDAVNNTLDLFLGRTPDDVDDPD